MRVLLRRLDAMNDRRRRARRALPTAALAGLPLVLPAERPQARHVYHLYVVRTPRRDALASFLNGARHPDRHPLPGAEPPAARGRAPRAGAALPRTERLVDEILTLPISAGHTEAEIDDRDRGGARLLRCLMGTRAERPFGSCRSIPKADYFTGAAIQLRELARRPGRRAVTTS